jgi:hypothetical protein
MFELVLMMLDFFMCGCRCAEGHKNDKREVIKNTNVNKLFYQTFWFLWN